MRSAGIGWNAVPYRHLGGSWGCDAMLLCYILCLFFVCQAVMPISISLNWMLCSFILIIIKICYIYLPACIHINVIYKIYVNVHVCTQETFTHSIYRAVKASWCASMATNACTTPPRTLLQSHECPLTSELSLLSYSRMWLSSTLPAVSPQLPPLPLPLLLPLHHAVVSSLVRRGKQKSRRERRRRRRDRRRRRRREWGCGVGASLEAPSRCWKESTICAWLHSMTALLISWLAVWLHDCMTAWLYDCMTVDTMYVRSNSFWWLSTDIHNRYQSQYINYLIIWPLFISSITHVIYISYHMTDDIHDMLSTYRRSDSCSSTYYSTCCIGSSHHVSHHVIMILY